MKTNKLLLTILLFLVILSFSVFADLRIASSSHTPVAIEFTSSNSVPVTVTLNILNTGADAVSVVEIAGVVSGPSQVSEISATLINIESNQTKTATLTFNFPRSSKPGAYTLNLKVKNLDNEENIVAVNKAVTVVASPAFEILQSGSVLSEIKITGQPGEEIVRLPLTIKNAGNVDLSNIRLTTEFSDLTDDDDDTITLRLNPATLNSLTIGSTANFELTATIQSGFDVEDLSGNLAVEANEMIKKTLPAKIEVTPLTCKASALSNNLKINIEEPEDDQDFQPGDDMQVRVDITNDASDDKRIRVQALLYNLDEGKRVDSDTTEKRINNNDEGSVFFEFPLAGEDFDEDTELRLYIKAFEKGKEDTICVEDSIDLNLEIPENAVEFDSLTLNPTAVSCGGTASVNAVLRNIGSEDQRVTVNVENAALGISQLSEGLSLSEDRNDDDNVQSTSVMFRVPSNVQNGNYPLTVTARYSGEVKTEQLTLAVTNCGTQPSQPSGQPAGDQANQPNDSGSTGTVPVGTSQPTYTGATVTDKSFWDTGITKIPTAIWVLAYIILALGIIVLLVSLFRRR